MTRTITIAVFVTVLTGMGAVSTSAQEHTTFLMRSGARLSVQLIDMGGVGFNVVVNGEDRQIPVGDVAAIEFGAAVAPEDAARRPVEGRHTVWLRNGDVIDGQLYDIEGARPLHITVKTEDGEVRLSSSEIRRIVLAPAAEPAGRSGSVAAAQTATGIDAPGSAGWIPIGSVVRRGEVLILSSTGQVQLRRAAEDVAAPAGARSQRMSPDAPLPTVGCGAVVATLGDSGPALSHRRSAAATMPAAGQLFLGVNDSRLAGNTGIFA